MKKYIPNILTTFRFVISFCFPYLFYNKKFKILIILFFLAIISDIFDGVLARKWNVTSNYGKIVDAMADKMIALIASYICIIINKHFIINIIFELIIIIINILNYIKFGILNNESSFCGKIKTWFLFITLLIGFLSLKYKFFDKYIFKLIFCSAILQVFTIINYEKKNNN